MTGRIHGRISACSSRTAVLSSLSMLVLSGLLLFAVGCSRSSVQGQATSNEPAPAPVTVNMPRAEEPGAKPAASPTSVGRGWTDAQANYQTLGVRHWQLYLESPFERDGSTNGQWETWGLEDVVATTADPAIFLGRIIASPVRVALNHPWSCETSRSVFDAADPTYEQPETPSGMIRFDNP